MGRGLNEALARRRAMGFAGREGAIRRIGADGRIRSRIGARSVRAASADPDAPAGVAPRPLLDALCGHAPGRTAPITTFASQRIRTRGRKAPPTIR